MNSPTITSWLDPLWDAVCDRIAQPLSGVSLDEHHTLPLATQTFHQFLENNTNRQPDFNTLLSVLTYPAKNNALQYIADQRKKESNPDLFRDFSKTKWEKNPNLRPLITRGVEGELNDPNWSFVEPILWNRAAPIYHRLRINPNDARDVYSETIANFLQPRQEPQKCPFRKIQIFEELPILFAVVAERRAISWIRKETSLKMAPNRKTISFDDPDIGPLESRIVDQNPDPLSNTSFERIRQSCSETLNDFQWHLLETIFVSCTKTREQLVTEPWVLQRLNLKKTTSRTTKLRHLNKLLSQSLTKLGHALETADL